MTRSAYSIWKDSSARLFPVRVEVDCLTNEKGVLRVLLVFQDLLHRTLKVFNDGSRSPFVLDFIDFYMLISVESS